MTDEVDITAPVLPKVGETDTTTPTLQPVKETVAALEPVEAHPATTLELEDDAQEDIVTDRHRVPAPKPKAPRALDADVKPPTAQRKAVVKAPLRGDGFEVAVSLEALPPTAPVTSRSAQLTALVERSGWVVLALVAAGLLGLAVWFWRTF